MFLIVTAPLLALSLRSGHYNSVQIHMFGNLKTKFHITTKYSFSEQELIFCQDKIIFPKVLLTNVVPKTHFH